MRGSEKIFDLRRDLYRNFILLQNKQWYTFEQRIINAVKRAIFNSIQDNLRL
jgi:hypothetical protein